MLRAFEKIKDAGLGTEVMRKIEYPSMGKYADILRFGYERTDQTAGSGAVPRFTDATEESGIDFVHSGDGTPLDDEPGTSAARHFGGGGACADFDGDGDLDIFLTNVSPPGDGNRLYFNDGQGKFSDATADSGLAGGAAGIGAAAGDYDNDGRMDLYVTNDGPNQLFRNLGEGKFKDVTDESGTAAGTSLSIGAVFVDIDSEGDLDLLVAQFNKSPAEEHPPFQWLINRRDGTFAADDGRLTIQGLPAKGISAAFGDLDNDFDQDALLFTRAGAPQLLRNERLEGMSQITESPWTDFQRPMWGAALADVDGNETMDAVLFAGRDAPVLLLKNDPPGRFQAGFQKLDARATNGAFFDAENDGDEDLFLTDALRSGKRSPALYVNNGNGRWTDVTARSGLANLAQAERRGALYADFDQDGDTDVLLINSGSRVTYLRNETPAENQSVTLNLIGTRAQEKTRSATLPVGTKVFAQAGAHHQKKELMPATGFLSQHSPRPTFGLGRRTRLDYVRLIWPDGVLQSEMEVAAGQTFAIKETYRKTSSCPLLFAWNGERFEFITDLLGGGGLGFFLSPGNYAPPQPIERVRIGPSKLRPKDGFYELRINEPLEEAVYVDQLNLIVLDHPAGCTFYPDERFETGSPARVDRFFCVRKPILPVRARTDKTGDVLDRILTIDRRTVDDFVLDHRFLGFCEPHSLELDFGDQIQSLALDRPLILYLYGWVEYPYSQTNYAALQAGLRLQPPSLQIPGTDGGWRTVLPEVGYPAGMPKMMTLDVSKWARESKGRFRLVTNMEVYWDSAFIARDEPVQKRMLTLAAARADLRPSGFPREYSPDGRLPLLFDYGLMDPNPGFKLMAGSYTRFGDVRDLLAQADDQFAVFGRGDEIALSFDAADLPPLAPGWSRTFILHADGYCKDMDLYTAEGQAVEPMPFHSMTNYPYPDSERYPDDASHRHYQKKYNTRSVRR